MADDDILSKVEDYLLDDQSVGDEFEAFIKTHCVKFSDAEENKLEYTTIYNQFCDIFNQRIETFIKKAGSTSEEFYKKAEQVQKTEAEAPFVVQLIWAVTSFEQFKSLMIEEKRKLE